MAGDLDLLNHNCGGEAALNAARNIANDATQVTPGRLRPAVAEAIDLGDGGAPIAYASVRGGQPTLHSKVGEILSRVPASQRGRGHGRCGLALCLTEALSTGRDPYGATAAAVTVRSRVTHESHGVGVGACSSCSSLVEHFNLKFVTG
ncbi:YwqJ-related putative deaminase [Nocardiopsis valliformis]|uniref:YwqJ-related putative deaminase n=1 Tax=Nocardiopsis valliformis TaxID=239974 RepID=UPI00373AE67A